MFYLREGLFAVIEDGKGSFVAMNGLEWLSCGYKAISGRTCNLSYTPQTAKTHFRGDSLSRGGRPTGIQLLSEGGG